MLAAVAHVSPFNRDLTAFCILLVWVTLTGGLHLDGFGDCCDGLLASVAAEKRLNIMRDPRADVWAAAGLTLLLLGKWLALRSIAPEWLPLAPVLGRWAMVWVLYQFPTIRGEGLGARFRTGLTARELLIASAWVAILLTRPEIGALWLLIFCFTTLFGGWAAQRLGGGLNGDVYGATASHPIPPHARRTQSRMHPASAGGVRLCCSTARRSALPPSHQRHWLPALPP